jgi:hypothetical protein
MKIFIARILNKAKISVTYENAKTRCFLNKFHPLKSHVQRSSMNNYSMKRKEKNANYCGIRVLVNFVNFFLVWWGRRLGECHSDLMLWLCATILLTFVLVMIDILRYCKQGMSTVTLTRF